MIRKYRELTRLEMEQVDKEETIVLIPVGALEQHGNQAPLGTDDIIAEAMVEYLGKALEEAGDKIDANDKTAVQADLAALKELLAKSKPEETTEAEVAEIKAAQEKLMQSAQKLFAKMYEQAGANAGAGAGPNPGAGAGPNPGAGPAPDGFQGDDVVDGDYKEV